MYYPTLVVITSNPIQLSAYGTLVASLTAKLLVTYITNKSDPPEPPRTTNGKLIRAYTCAPPGPQDAVSPQPTPPCPMDCNSLRPLVPNSQTNQQCEDARGVMLGVSRPQRCKCQDLGPWNTKLYNTPMGIAQRTRPQERALPAHVAKACGSYPLATITKQFTTCVNKRQPHSILSRQCTLHKSTHNPHAHALSTHPASPPLSMCQDLTVKETYCVYVWTSLCFPSFLLPVLCHRSCRSGRT
jgi:hypothetical protein